MTSPKTKVAAGAAACVGILGVLAGPALAGPCAEQISELSRMLSNDPSMGPATTGALAGAAPGAIQQKAPAPDPDARSVDPAPSLSPGGKTSGSAGTSEMNAASSQIATSAQDVRLQQKGMPTVAQGGDPAKADDRMSQAKMALESARALDQQGSQDCMGKLDQARKLMQGG